LGNYSDNFENDSSSSATLSGGLENLSEDESSSVSAKGRFLSPTLFLVLGGICMGAMVYTAYLKDKKV